MERIFVQIASYRDPELVPTIKDCLSKAKYPKRLSFGICWQNCEMEYSKISNFLYSIPNSTILDVPYQNSKGACWARSEIQKLYKGEEYTLQLDSHHRFTKGWDEELIHMMKLTESKKPILTSYASSYEPDDEKLCNQDPCQLDGKHFTPDGSIRISQSAISDWKELEKPIRGRYISAHYLFTIGKFCEECPYDPYLYFDGEEPTLSLRAFTHGYDIFHPHKSLIWHEYTRNHRVKHWDDFGENDESDSNLVWWEVDRLSKMRVRQLFGIEDNNINLGKYGLGNVRTIEEYELYAGISFKNRSIHSLSSLGTEPPINDSTNWWNRPRLHKFNIEIPEYDGDFNIIFIGFHDINGNELYRQDLTYYCKNLDVLFTSKYNPYKWVYWVLTTEGEWVNRQEFVLG